MYEEDCSLARFASNDLNKELVENWYQARAIQLEDRSKLVDHALSLITLGLARGVMVSCYVSLKIVSRFGILFKGLEDLSGELSTLETLVYEVQVEELSLTGLRSYNTLEQAHLLVSKVKLST